MKAYQLVLTKNHENINEDYFDGCLYTTLDIDKIEFKEENICYYRYCNADIEFCKGLDWGESFLLNSLPYSKIFKKIKAFHLDANAFELKKLFCYSTLEIINRNIEDIDYDGYYSVSAFIPNAEEIAKAFYAESKRKKSKINVEGLKTFFSDKKYIFPKKYENMFKSLEDYEIHTIHYTTFYFLNYYSKKLFRNYEGVLKINTNTDTPEKFWNWLKDFKLEKSKNHIVA